jgi:ribonuclease HI
VNCDAAFDTETWNGGWGCVLRDSDGDVVEARRGRIEALLNPLQGEMIACIHGVQTAIDAGVGHVVIESDAPLSKQSTRAPMTSVLSLRARLAWTLVLRLQLRIFLL